MSMESSIQIEERAAEWLARRDSERWTESDEAEFNAWLEQSTLHVVAFVRLEAVWKQALRLKALSAGIEPGTVPSPDAWQLTPFFDRGTISPPESSESSPSHSVGPSLSSNVERGSRIAVTIPLENAATAGGAAEGREPLSAERRGRRREAEGEAIANSSPLSGEEGARESRKVRPYSVRLFAVAASIVLAIGAGTVAYFWPFAPTYSTPVGGIAAVPMVDGSKVTLNTNSEIRVAVTDRERRVQLEHGEAFFEVAKDPNRPFVVNAGKTRVVALGTKFSVRREGNDVRVFVTEGKVRFEDASSPLRTSDATVPAPGGESEESAPREGEASADFHSGKIFLTAGSVARATDESVLVQEKEIQEIETYLSWRTGYLIFRDMALSEAIAEFNRYNTRKIVIDDPAIEVIRISGKFRSTQFEAFVRLLEEGFAIHAERIDDRIVLSDSRDTRAQGTAASP